MRDNGKTENVTAEGKHTSIAVNFSWIANGNITNLATKP
jgi:hypothetical protein